MAEVKKRFDELDGLKIFFALGVVLFHYWEGEGGHKISNCPRIAEFVYVYGWLGVEFFFILSGFLMEHTYRKIIDVLSFPKFIGRRLKSLYAPYLCAECVGIAVVFLDCILLHGHFAWGPGYEVTLSKIISSLTMSSQGWTIDRYPFMAPAWYVDILVLCYVLYFVVLRFAKWIKIKPIYLYIFVLLLTYGFCQTGFSFPYFISSSNHGYMCFFIGCILYNIQKNGVFNKRFYVVLLDFIVLILFVLGHKFGIPNVLGDVKISFSFFIFPVLILTVENLPVVKKIFSCKVLTFASKYTMDIYLIHMAVLLLTLIFNEYFDWNLNFASYKVLGCILLIIFAFVFVWHWLMAIITPAFNRWFVNFITPAKAAKTE